MTFCLSSHSHPCPRGPPLACGALSAVHSFTWQTHTGCQHGSYETITPATEETGEQAGEGHPAQVGKSW